MKSYNSLNQSGNHSPKIYYDEQKSMINQNIKSLDNSFDISQKKKKIGRTIYNPNYNSINVNSNKNIYAKKISNNNSPRRFNPSEANDFNNLNSMKNIRNGKVYNKINKKSTAYIKKSPGRIKELNNSNYNYNNYRNNNKNVVKNIYNLKTKYNYIYNNPGNNNYNYINTNINNINNINNSNNNNLGSFEVSSIYGLNSSTDTYTTNRYDYINTNYNNNYSNKNKNNNIENKQKENSMLFNLEDLIVLEERLNDINFSLESNNNIEKQCFNFWNYYYNCSLYQILEKIFPNEEDSNIIRLSINYELM